MKYAIRVMSLLLILILAQTMSDKVILLGVTMLIILSLILVLLLWIVSILQDIRHYLNDIDSKLK